ncbi:hypothetical protein HQN90_07425 [Paenibacillus alba]|nr:hypothetical protein [Paenibacillus alba]
MSCFHLGIITNEVSQDLRTCPNTILRRHPACTLYVNTDSYGEVPDERGDAHGAG